MTLATPTPEQDDYDVRWTEEYQTPDPMCRWCDDTGWRWTLGPGHRAEYTHCDQCWEGDDECPK